MDPTTRAAYDSGAKTYATNRGVHDPGRAEAFRAAIPAGRRLDLGCGPGLWFDLLGRPLIGCDTSGPMLDVAGATDRSVPLVAADLAALPFTPASFSGIWANKCLQHVPRDELARVLVDLHRLVAPGGVLWIEAFAGSGEFRSDDDLPGRHFTLWDPDEFADMVLRAGFSVDDLAVGATQTTPTGHGFAPLTVAATRLHTDPGTWS